MKRIWTLAVAFLATTAIYAGEYAGKVTKVVDDANTKSITITMADGKEKFLLVDRTATFIAKGKKNKQMELKDGLKSVKAGQEVTLTTDKRDGEEVITKVSVSGPLKKKKD